MKSVTTNVVASIQVIGHGVEVCMLWDGMMEGRVKNCDLRQFWTKYVPRRQNTLDVVGVVQGSQIDAFLNSL
jgi:hypothetical protein